MVGNYRLQEKIDKSEEIAQIYYSTNNIPVWCTVLCRYIGRETLISPSKNLKLFTMIAVFNFYTKKMVFSF